MLRAFGLHVPAQYIDRQAGRGARTSSSIKTIWVRANSPLFNL